MLNPIVLMHFVSGAHNDALMVGLVVAGLALAAQQRCIWGAVAVSLAVAVKPIALIALPFVGLLWAGRDGGWVDRIRSWAFAGLALVCTLASRLPRRRRRPRGRVRRLRHALGRPHLAVPHHGPGQGRGLG